MKLFFLYSMVHNFNINTGAFLAKHMDSVATATSGDIMIGGLIILITLHLGHNLNDLPQA